MSHTGEIWNWWKHGISGENGIQMENSLRNYVNFTIWNRFSWTFKVLKPMSFRGLRPLDPCQGFCPWTPTRGPKALDPTHAGLRGKPLKVRSMSACYSQFRYSLEIEMCSPTHNILRTPLRPCNISPYSCTVGRGITLAMVITCSSSTKYAL